MTSDIIFPAAFGRLCVETGDNTGKVANPHPAAFGRLCVETVQDYVVDLSNEPAAFGRLCVETDKAETASLEQSQPPSGGCVLKPPYI